MTIPTPLDERFRAAAAAEGLLDVAYDVVDDTPVGPLLVGVTDHGVCRISFDPDPEQELEELARLHGTRVLRSARPVDRFRHELDEYFAGRRRHFDLEPDKKYVVSVGSVGQPRDFDNRASFTVYDSDKKRFEFKRIEYDIELAADKVLRARLERNFAHRLFIGV